MDPLEDQLPLRLQPPVRGLVERERPATFQRRGPAEAIDVARRQARRQRGEVVPGGVQHGINITALFAEAGPVAAERSRVELVAAGVETDHVGQVVGNFALAFAIGHEETRMVTVAVVRIFGAVQVDAGLKRAERVVELRAVATVDAEPVAVALAVVDEDAGPTPSTGASEPGPRSVRARSSSSSPTRSCRVSITARP